MSFPYKIIIDNYKKLVKDNDPPNIPAWYKTYERRMLNAINSIHHPKHMYWIDTQPPFKKFIK